MEYDVTSGHLCAHLNKPEWIAASFCVAPRRCYAVIGVCGCSVVPVVSRGNGTPSTHPPLLMLILLMVRAASNQCAFCHTGGGRARRTILARREIDVHLIMLAREFVSCRVQRELLQ